jgi:DNA-binding transcriptional LysR family regulator
METFATIVCPLGAVMPPGHELAAHASVTLAHCRDLPLVLADVGMPLRLVLDDASMAGGLNLEPVVESNSLETLKRTVKLGLGVTFLYRIDVEEDIQRGDLAFVPVDDPHVARQMLRIVYRPGAELDGAALAFAEVLAAAMAPSVDEEGAAKKAPHRAQIDARRRQMVPLEGGRQIRLAARGAGQ